MAQNSILRAFARRSTSAKRLMAALHDIVMACAALSLTLGARYGFDFLFADQRVLPWVALFGAISGIAFFAFGVGRGIWRFASLTDLKKISTSSAVAILVFLIVEFLLNRLDGLPRSMPFLTWVNMVFLLGAPRLLYRAFRDGGLQALRAPFSDEAAAEDILLIGPANDADQAIRSFMLDTSRRYRVRAIIETRPGKAGREVRGIPILGDMGDVTPVIERFQQSGVRIAAAVMVSPKADKEALFKIANTLAGFGIALRRTPVSQFSHSDPQMEAVTLEDLLGRPSLTLDLAGISALIKGRKVLVTGAGGSIGSEIVRQVAALAPGKLVLFDHSEFNLYTIDEEMDRRFPDVPRVPILGDVRALPVVRRLFAQEAPDIVFHAAALKHVPLVEANVCEGVHTNVIGTRNCADAAIEAKAQAFVMISTDKAVRPTSVMGATKRVAELYCQALDTPSAGTRFITVRFGNVLGSTGSVVPHFKQQIQAGGPITVTHPDMRRYFMVIKEATELVLQAAVAALMRPEDFGRVYVLDMGEPVRIVDLARTMIALAGLRPDEDIKIVFTGVRPGEKLFEEIFDQPESRIPSGKDGVFVARVSRTEIGPLRMGMDRLERAAMAGDHDGLCDALISLVPDLGLANDIAPLADAPDLRVVQFVRK